MEFEPGCFFETDVFEPYWGPTIIGRRPYEPEIRLLLCRLRDLKPVFVDCGANYGYWSIVSTGPMIGWQHAVAIEANPSTFRGLCRNARLNGHRFQCQNYAISDRSGNEVSLSAAESHARTHVAQGSDDRGPRVRTITIDDALEEAGFSDAGRFLIKLDIEGHEVSAFKGARRVREQEHVLVFEDWSRNDFSTMRDFISRGYRIFFISRQGSCHRVREGDALGALVGVKRRWLSPTNLVACPTTGSFSESLKHWASSS